MPEPRSFRLIPLVLILGCAHAPAEVAQAPAPAPVAREPGAPEHDEAVPASEARVATQQIDFAEGDVDAGPTTQVRGAPKRPPLPRFKLFGTREGDGP